MKDIFYSNKIQFLKQLFSIKYNWYVHPSLYLLYKIHNMILFKVLRMYYYSNGKKYI